MSFRFYCGFCERCERYYMRSKKYGNKVCVYCYKGNQNLRDHYPYEEVEEFLSKTKNSFYVVKDNKVFKANCINKCNEKGGFVDDE